MMYRKIKLIIAALMLLPAFAQANVTSLSSDQIKQLLIQQSIANYPGDCPCPYSINRAGRHCGNWSVWSKPGGYSPLCYPSDVSAQMVANFRNSVASLQSQKHG